MLKNLLTLKWIQGHRTQVAAVAIAVLTFLVNVGHITQDQFNAAVGFLTSVGLITASVHKS